MRDCWWLWFYKLYEAGDISLDSIMDNTDFKKTQPSGQRVEATMQVPAPGTKVEQGCPGNAQHSGYHYRTQ
jgi:hypothetical protein